MPATMLSKELEELVRPQIRAGGARSTSSAWQRPVAAAFVRWGIGPANAADRGDHAAGAPRTSGRGVVLRREHGRSAAAFSVARREGLSAFRHVTQQA